MKYILTLLLTISILLNLFLWYNLYFNSNWDIVDTENTEKPNITTDYPQPTSYDLTISRLWWSLSRDIAIVWDQTYQNGLYTETYPVPGDFLSKLWWYFNAWWYAYFVSCPEWYQITSCVPFNTDINNFSPLDDLDRCWLMNEDPDLMRISLNMTCQLL